jgi:hypothetical protein
VVTYPSSASPQFPWNQDLEVFLAGAERGQLEPEDVQPVIEIAAEGSLLHACLDVAVGRRDDGRLDFDLPFSSQAAKAPILDRFQPLDLELERHRGGDLSRR